MGEPTRARGPRPLGVPGLVLSAAAGRADLRAALLSGVGGRVVSEAASLVVLAAVLAAAVLAGAGWRYVIHPEVPLDPRLRLRDRVAVAMQGVATAFETSIAEKPEGWHMLGRIWADVPPDPPRAARAAGGAR